MSPTCQVCVANCRRPDFPVTDYRRRFAGNSLILLKKFGNLRKESNRTPNFAEVKSSVPPLQWPEVEKIIATRKVDQLPHSALERVFDDLPASIENLGYRANASSHEAEILLTKKTHQHKICPATARPRARESRSLE
jgi:hypothetical protein